MASFRLENIVQSVKRDVLYEWYTDFQPADLQILAKEGAKGNFTSRQVKKEGNRVTITSGVVVQGSPMKLTVNGILHPESHSYEANVKLPGVFEDNRIYRFIDVREGTKVTMDADLRCPQQMEGVLEENSKKIMDAYLAAAEKELNTLHEQHL